MLVRNEPRQLHCSHHTLNSIQEATILTRAKTRNHYFYGVVARRYMLLSLSLGRCQILYRGNDSRLLYGIQVMVARQVNRPRGYIPSLHVRPDWFKHR